MLKPQTYRIGMTAENLEQLLASVPSKVDRTIIRTTLANADDTTIPTTKAVQDALDVISGDFSSLGNLAFSDDVDLSSSQTKGVTPISKGGTGANTLENAQSNLGIITQPEIEDLIDSKIPVIQEVDLGSSQTTGVLPLGKGGTGGVNAQQARDNIGVYSKTRQDDWFKAFAWAANFDFTAGGILTDKKLFVYNAPDGKIYKYIGVLDAPITVVPGTNPVGNSNWSEVVLDDHARMSNKNAPNAHQQYRESATVAQIQSGIYKIGTLLSVSDRADAPFNIEPLGSYIVNGFDIIYAGVNEVAILQVLNNVHNIVHYGAVDGAPDNTEPMRATMNAAGVTKGFYFEPIGLWIHGQIDWRDGVIGWGSGYESVDQRLSDVGNLTVTNVGYRFFNTDTVAPFDPELNLKNIRISNIRFKGTVESDGFAEFKHLFMTQGVTDFRVSGCWFEGWQGDAIVIRSGNSTAAAKNINVHIHGNWFDGVNNDNRQAISITDVNGCWIHNNYYRNCTRSDQPGAIDIEPNTPDTFVTLRNIHIYENDFKNIGGNVGCITMFLPIANGQFTNGDPENITVRDNTIDGCNTAFNFKQVQTAPADETYNNLNLKVFNNTIKNCLERPLWIYGLRGVEFRGNTYNSSPLISRIGYNANANQGCYDVNIDDEFIECGNSDGIALGIYNSNKLKIPSTYRECGVTGGGFGVPLSFVYGANDQIDLENMEIINTTGRATAGITVGGGVTAGVISDLSRMRLAGLSMVGIGSAYLRTVKTTGGAIAASDTGKTFYLNNAAGFTLTLPLPADGLKFKFIVKTAPTGGDYRIPTNGAATIIYGTINETVDANAGTVQAASIKTFSANTSLVGDWMTFESDGTNWYVNGSTQANFGIG